MLSTGDQQRASQDSVVRKVLPDMITMLAATDLIEKTSPLWSNLATGYLDGSVAAHGVTSIVSTIVAAPFVDPLCWTAIFFYGKSETFAKGVGKVRVGVVSVSKLVVEKFGIERAFSWLFSNRSRMEKVFDHLFESNLKRRPTSLRFHPGVL